MNKIALQSFASRFCYGLTGAKTFREVKETGVCSHIDLGTCLKKDSYQFYEVFTNDDESVCVSTEVRVNQNSSGKLIAGFTVADQAVDEKSSH